MQRKLEKQEKYAIFFEWLDNNMFIINLQNMRDKIIQLLKSAATSTKRSSKTEVEGRPWKFRWFWADSQSDFSKNMPVFITNQIEDVLYVDDNN